ncbi:MAG: hypothetical protein KIS67_29255 [Verrucomicrobiae bacterium]|nr:hypothetical protein [Verrucomicrobiae bacterium]
MSAKFEHLLATPEPAELGPGPRESVHSAKKLEAAMAGDFASSKLPPAAQQLIRALVLLWHDHLDASHTISQGIESPDGSLVHAIMHRREPDYWNATYWWRRVGQHPCFPELARRVADLLKARNESQLARKLIPNGNWDAFAFVDACAAAADKHTNAQLLREIQQIETEVALDHFLGREAR